MPRKPTAEAQYRATKMQPGEDACKVCGKPTKFTTSNRGYLPTCSRSCGGVYLRRNIKADPVKYASLNAKISANNRKYRQSLSKEERTELAAKISTSLVKRHEEASPDERKRLMGIYGQCLAEPYTPSIEDFIRDERVHRSICSLFGMDSSWIDDLVKGHMYE